MDKCPVGLMTLRPPLQSAALLGSTQTAVSLSAVLSACLLLCLHWPTVSLSLCWERWVPLRDNKDLGLWFFFSRLDADGHGVVSYQHVLTRFSPGFSWYL